MYFFPSRLVFMFAVVAVAFSAPAQQTIISSKPADLPADKANSFLPSANHHAGDYNAPVELFHDYTPDLPMPPPLNLNNNDASVQEALDKRKNWTLLTPEQILGVQTPEEILGVEDRPEEKNLSLEEQFLLRERRETAFAATNGRAGNIDWRGADDDNPFNRKNKNDGSDSFPEAQAKMEPGQRYFNQLLDAQNAAPGSTAAPDEKSSSAWNSVFAQPDQPKQTPEQLADMERFRALMEPSTPPDKASLQTSFSVPTAPPVDPFLQPAPVVNPAGRDITPLDNVFSRPTGITPLPGISTPPPKPAAVTPSWQAQLPPWMQSGPPAQNPNRNF
jgi:hypothetical protein